MGNRMTKIANRLTGIRLGMEAAAEEEKRIHNEAIDQAAELTFGYTRDKILELKR